MALRVLLPWASVASFAFVNATAIAMGSRGEARPLFLLCALLAVTTAAQSAAWDPDGLAAAIILSLPPLLGLLGPAGAIWLIGPLGAGVLLASELNVAGWEARGGAGGATALDRARLARIAQLGAGGLLASVGVGVVGLGPALSGTAAVLLGAAALATLAWVMFGRGG